MTFFGINFSALNANDILTDDLRKSSETTPTVIPNIDLVYVLSGRSSALGANVDQLKNEDGSEREIDYEDDRERLKEGIRIANEVNALRANKRVEDLAPEDHVIPIFYAGRKMHNEHLIEALKQGLIPYPKELFIIRNISPDTTIGQVRALKAYLSHYRHDNIAVVSSAYHLARTARTIGCNSPQVMEEDYEPPIKEVNFYLFGVHKNEARPGIFLDVRGEYRAMQKYSSGKEMPPSISRTPSPNTFLNDVDALMSKSLKRAMFWSRIEKHEPVVDNSRALVLRAPKP